MKRSRAAGIMARAGAVPFWGPLGAVLAILLLAGPAGAQQPPAQAGGDLPVRAVRQIRAILAEKARRTPTQQKGAVARFNLGASQAVFPTPRS